MPTLVLIAGRDMVIPRASTDALIAAFKRKPEVVVIAGASHNDIAEDDGYRRDLAVFLTR